jgi:hypothetical protein
MKTAKILTITGITLVAALLLVSTVAAMGAFGLQHIRLHYWGKCLAEELREAMVVDTIVHPIQTNLAQPHTQYNTTSQSILSKSEE